MDDDVWPAPAKINLFLHIVGRHSDGYHQLQTVFQLLEFGDELRFKLNKTGLIKLASNYDNVSLADDIIYRSATLLKEVTGIAHGVSININKQIPIGGGLGGGSTDAATTLVALNEIWGTGLSNAELAELGLKLGADVPVFIYGDSAWAEGIGEQLKPIILPESWYLVIDPGCHVDTSQVFNNPDLTRNSSPITIRDFESGACRNDCEDVVFREFPQTAEAADWLEQWTKARLTGTGACVFGSFKSIQSVTRIFDQLPRKWQGFVSKGINKSPLLERKGRFVS